MTGVMGKIEIRLAKAIKSVDLLKRNMTEEGEDAMLTTKGFKCASCEKGIVNLYGTMKEW
jgi:hypothetical protein